MVKDKYKKNLYRKKRFKKETIIEKELHVTGQTFSYLLTNPTTTAPVLFCLPGLYETKEQLAEFAKAIGSAYRVLVIDWLGHGQSTNDATYWTIEGQVSLLDQVLSRIREQYEVAAVIGQSFGATLLLMHANLQPETTVILGNLTHLRTQKTEQLYTQMIEQGGHSPYIIESEADFHQLMYLYYSQPEQLTNNDWKRWKTTTFEQSKIIGPALEAWYAEFSLFFTESFLTHCQAQRTLIVWGEEDPLYDVRKGNIVKWTIPRSTISLVKQAGHLPLSEQPKQAAEIITQFLQRGDECNEH
ncbi:MAG: alpha/beta fold hydrolase [Culicoidibacterales bacterium]